jgi:hypothetical protein
MPEPAGGPRSGASRTAAGGRAPGAVVAALATGALLVAGGPAARADPGSGTGTTTAAAAPASAVGTGAQTLCRLTDARLPELSGLAVSGDRMLAMNDGGDRLTVYALDTTCRVVAVRTADVDPYDPEDLAVAPDGTVWFADTGDNRADRATVALLAMWPTGPAGIYRMTYPDGPHDAESLLLAPDGTPYIVTKELLGVSGVYRPNGALVDGGTVPLERTGTVTLAATGTPGGPVGRTGEVLATGGAVSRDGRFVALRTYTDAYVWPLTGSDVPAALAGQPTRIPLPPAPQGEAISFGPDGRSLVVAGEGLPGDITEVPLPASLLAGPATTAGGTEAGGGGGGTSWLIAGIIAVCVATLVVWLGGVAARLRRRGGPTPPAQNG